LVAAKVAASLRVNGDTIADDSLAELDGITGNDIVATLTRIITGDTKLNTQSLQKAFAEANASLRQANTVIGEYKFVDDEPEPEILTGDEAQTIIDATLTLQANPQQTPTTDMTSASSVEPLEAFERAQQAHIVDDLPSVGQQQSLLFSNGRAANGQASDDNPLPIPTSVNGQPNSHTESRPHPNKNGDKPKHEADEKRPPVPRPRLLIGQLAGRS
jgi:hypothetical protein